MTLDAERDAVVTHAPTLAGLAAGHVAELSVRSGDRFAVTPAGGPAGSPADAFDAADVPVLDLDGERIADGRDPADGAAVHRHVYRDHIYGGRPDAPSAVVRLEPPMAATMAVLREPIPPVHDDAGAVGRRVPVVDHETDAAAVASAVIAAMAEADAAACLVANRGLIAVGGDAATAVDRAARAERLAELYLRARSVGDPTELDDAALDAALARHGGPGGAGTEP